MIAAAALVGVFLVGIVYQSSYAQVCISHLVASMFGFLVENIRQRVTVRSVQNRRLERSEAARRPRMRSRAYKLIVSYLLLRIGFVGGAELASQDLSITIVPAILAVGLSIILCLLALTLLNSITSIDRTTKAALATHYGSVSVGTFTVALAFLNGLAVHYSSMVTVWVALMELPAVFIGMAILGRKAVIFRHLFREDPELLTLPFALVAGLIAGPYVLHNAAVTFGGTRL